MDIETELRQLHAEALQVTLDLENLTEYLCEQAKKGHADWMDSLYSQQAQLHARQQKLNRRILRLLGLLTATRNVLHRAAQGEMFIASC